MIGIPPNSGATKQLPQFKSGGRGERTRSQETDYVCFESTLGTILVTKSFQNPFKMEPIPLTIEFGKPFWSRGHPGSIPGVSWGEVGGSRDPFWDGSGLPKSSKIQKKSRQKTMRFENSFCKVLI